MQTMDAAEFTAMVAIQGMQMMDCVIEEEVSADKKTVAKIPDKFKDPKTFRIFDEGMWTYLGLLKGTGRVPLKYVIWRLAIAEAATVYQMTEEQQVAITPLFGPGFDRDNARVYNILKQLCLEGPARTYILPFDARSDGRAA